MGLDKKEENGLFCLWVLLINDVSWWICWLVKWNILFVYELKSYIVKNISCYVLMIFLCKYIFIWIMNN